MFEDRFHGIKNNPTVAEESNAGCIINIHLELIIPIHGVSSVSLCITRKARSDVVALTLVFRVPRQIVHMKRSGAYDRHVTFDYVDQLREFIKGRRAKLLAKPGKSDLIGKKIAVTVTCIGHGAE